MTFPNHIAAGITFTGILSAICGTNIFSNPIFIALAIFAAVLPDIDHPVSPVGKSVYPLSKWLHKKYGHRTLSHSLLALLSLSFLVGITESWFHEGNEYKTIFFFGYLSHIIGDMITIQGVQLFYPFSKSACVIPGKREYRFKTGKLSHETMIFAAIALTFFFCQPLMHNGFWTTYNSAFGTPKHLFSEFKKSEDLLEVTYEYREGSEILKGIGYCIEASEDEFTLIENNKFKLLNSTEQVILSTTFKHTKKKFQFHQKSFVGISADSLNKLLEEKQILQLEVQSNKEFITQKGKSKEQSKSYTDTYLNIQPYFYDTLAITSNNSSYLPSTNPRIISFQEKLKDQIQKQALIHQKLKTKNQKLKLNIAAGKEETDIYTREKIMKEIEELEKEIKKLNPKQEVQEEKIKEIRRQIRELRKGDLQKNSKEFLRLAAKGRGEVVLDFGFTGFFRFVVVEG